MGKPGRKSIWDTPPGSSPSLAEQDQGWGSQVETQTVPKPITPAVPIVEQLRVAKQVKRQRGWEQGNKTRSYWGIPLELREALGWIAQELCVKVDDVARAFFEYGLDEVQKGALDLIPHPNPKGPKMTLYPGGWKHQPWSRRELGSIFLPCAPAKNAEAQTRHAVCERTCLCAGCAPSAG